MASHQDKSYIIFISRYFARKFINSDKFSSVRAGPHSELDAMYLAWLSRKSTDVPGNGRHGESACAHVRRCKDENGPHGVNSCL